MTKENKIDEYGYGSEVDTLLKSGYSTYEVAEHINNTHDKKISHMSVQRWKEKSIKNELEDIIESGEDPEDIILSEFKLGLRENIERVNKAIKAATDLVEEAKKSDSVSFSDKTRAIDTLVKTLDQQKKSWTALIQNGTRQFRVLGDINLKKEQNVKILLLNWSRELCPECKQKISKLIEIKEEDIVNIEEENNDRPS